MPFLMANDHLIDLIARATEVDSIWCGHVAAYMRTSPTADYKAFTKLRLPAGYTFTMNVEAETHQLRLGDVVKTSKLDEAFTTATVINVTEDEVTLFRPYVHTSDYSHTSGVTPYIGFEQYKLSRNHGRPVFLYSRKELA